MMASTLLPNGCTIDHEQSLRLREGVPFLTPIVFLLLAQLARRSRALTIFAITVLAELLWTASVTVIYAASLSGLHEFGFALAVFSPELLSLLAATSLITWSARQEVRGEASSARARTWAITTLAAALTMSTRLVLCVGKGHLDGRLVLVAYGCFAILLAITAVRLRGHETRRSGPASVALLLTVFGLLAFAALPA